MSCHDATSFCFRRGRRTTLLLLSFAGTLCAREHIPLTVPFHKHSQTLIAASTLDDKNYIVAPVSILVDADELLIGFKRGYAHARDREAVFEIHSYRPSTGRLQGLRASLGEPLHTYYNGEFARYPDGTLSCFVDVQQGGNVGRVERLGLREARSADGGRTFSSPQRVGPLGGVEYGYVFDSVVRGARTYLLAMRFANLAGGRSLHDRWPHAGSVDVLVSEDNGGSWRFVRDLTAEFGNIAINESALLPWGDGWLIACRGYDNRQWLFRTDGSFRQLAGRDLTADFDCINSMLGRPRLYERDGSCYLIGRNWTRPTGRGERSSMQLCWFRFSPETLSVETCVVLDNASQHSVSDGYYATVHWRERGGVEFLNVITYKRADFVSEHRTAGIYPPDLIRLEFLWEELK